MSPSLNMASLARRYLPILEWGARYTGKTCANDLIVAAIVNMGSPILGGFPVTGGFARSVVNFEAGAETPAASAFTAVGIAPATLFLTPLLYYLPNATLAATIIVAVRRWRTALWCCFD
jgi:MFS superfamily sulfate permease-like transporter